MATLPLSLPVELLHDIVLYLDRDSLISLAQACHVLHAVAVHYLHRNVPRLSGPDTIRCLNTFATTSHIAGKVRTFNLYSSFAIVATLPPAAVQPRHKGVWNVLLDVFRPSPPPLFPLVPPYLHFIAGTERISLQTIANAFYNMKNLHTLIIHAPSHPGIWEFNHPIPSLRTVFVHRNAESPSLFVWIMTQQSITYLRMNFDKKWLPLPINKCDSSLSPLPSLPNLRYLACNSQGVFHFFPGGRVSELIIEDLFAEQDRTVDYHLATVIASSSAKSGIQLQRLTLYGAKGAINHLFERLDHLFPNLLFLRIFAVDQSRVSSTPQLLLKMRDSIFTTPRLSYRSLLPWTISYQNSLLSRPLSFSSRRQVLGT